MTRTENTIPCLSIGENADVVAVERRLNERRDLEKDLFLTARAVKDQVKVKVVLLHSVATTILPVAHVRLGTGRKLNLSPFARIVWESEDLSDKTVKNETLDITLRFKRTHSQPF